MPATVMDPRPDEFSMYPQLPSRFWLTGPAPPPAQYRAARSHVFRLTGMPAYAASRRPRIAYCEIELSARPFPPSSP